MPARAEGTVIRVYEEPLQGILMARDIVTRRDGVPTWVEVRLGEPLPDGRGSLFARVDDPDVLAGDRVDLEVGSASMPVTAPDGYRMSVEDAFRAVPGSTAGRPSIRSVAAVGHRLRVEVETPAGVDRSSPDAVHAAR